MAKHLDTPPVIYLLGFMGSGKTTFGKKLAKALGYSFVDLDELIEKQEKKSITEIFSSEGETRFREAESKCLKNFKSEKPTVMACGGGTPCYFDNLDWMNKGGITVYIRVPAKELARRLLIEKNHRPLIAGLSSESLEQFISNKLQSREEFFNQAKVIVDGTGITPEALIPLL